MRSSVPATPSSTEPVPSDVPPSSGFPWLTLGVLLVVAGAHLWLIAHYASDQPFSDQWGAEGHVVFEQHLHRQATWANYVYPHAEHRPVLMRVLTFGLFVANGQWDCRVEMLGSLIVYLAAVGALCEFARRILPARGHVAVALLAAVLFALPSNFENVLWGFQSQFYFLLLFGPLHVLGTCGTTRLEVRWWLAQLAGFLALFSIAAGPMSAVTSICLAAFALWRGQRTAWSWATLAVNLGLVLFAAWLRPEAAALNGLHAGTVGQFLLSLGRMLAWPQDSFAGLVLALPSVVYLASALRRRNWAPAQHQLIGLAVWFWLTVAVIAYGRGATPGGIAIRYFDVLVLGVFTNALALASLAPVIAGRRIFYFASATAWGAFLLAGCWSLNAPARLGPGLAGYRDFFKNQQVAVTGYLATGDESWLTRDALVRGYLPHFEFTKDVLRDPLLRRRLPPSIVPPLACVRDPVRSRGFAEPGRDGEIASGESPSPVAQEFVSEPLDRVGLPLLRLRVRGPLVPGSTEIFFEAGQGTKILPLGAPLGETGYWHTLNFVVPPGPLRLVAKISAGAPAIAFTPPVEVGWLSWLAPKVSSLWGWCLAGGILLLGVGAAMVRRRVPSRPLRVG